MCFGVYFDQILSPKFSKIIIFLDKNNDYSYTFVVGYLANGENLNMLQFMRFSVYFERIFKRNCYFLTEIMTLFIAARILGSFGGIYSSLKKS